MPAPKAAATRIRDLRSLTIPLDAQFAEQLAIVAVVGTGDDEIGKLPALQRWSESILRRAAIEARQDSEVADMNEWIARGGD